MLIGSDKNIPVYLRSNATNIATISSTGLDVTGTTTSTGQVTVTGISSVGGATTAYLGTSATGLLLNTPTGQFGYLASANNSVLTWQTGAVSVTGTLSATSLVTANSAYTSTQAILAYCDNTASNQAYLSIRKGRDVGAGSVDAVGLDALSGVSGQVPLYIRAGTALSLGVGGSTIGTFSSTGLAVTGTLTSTGNASFSTSSGGVSTIGTASSSAWSTENYKGFEINGGASFIGFVGNAQTFMLSNLYNDGTNYRYITTSGGGLYSIQGVASGAHVWYSAPSGSAGAVATLTQIMSVEPSKSLSLQGATPQTGTGITFPATQSASTDANTLDDYEEGTWTPTDSSGASLSLSVSNCRYTKIGRMVSIQGTITYPTTASGASAQFGGFPFASADQITVSVIYSDASVASFTYLSGNTTNVFLLIPGVNVVNSTMSGKLFTFSGTYAV
jgi:hypothetical protein